mgnify:CR=1 FL=1
MTYLILRLTSFFLCRIQSNEGLIKTKADKIRLKYYDSCRKMALAPLTGTRGRVSLIPEEGGECRPLLGGNHDTNSINSEALGFLVSQKQFYGKKILMKTSLLH